MIYVMKIFDDIQEKKLIKFHFFELLNDEEIHVSIFVCKVIE